MSRQSAFQGGARSTLSLCVEFFKIFHPSGSPLSPYLLCCRAFAVAYYSFTPYVLQLRRNRQLQILGFKVNSQETTPFQANLGIFVKFPLIKGFFMMKVQKIMGTSMILCQEDLYLEELVRYIHLNPLRAELVEDMEKGNR